MNFESSPVAFEMYVRSFELMIDIEVSMGEILSIIRASQDSATAYVMVCHYLDSLEIPKLEGPTE